MYKMSISLYIFPYSLPPMSIQSLLHTHFYLFWCVSQKVCPDSTENTGNNMAGRREEVLRQEETGTHSLFILEVER